MLGKHRTYFHVGMVTSLQDGLHRSPPPGTYTLVESFPSYATVGLCDQWQMAEVIAHHCQDGLYRSVASVSGALLDVLSDRGHWVAASPCDEDIQETVGSP